MRTELPIAEGFYEDASRPIAHQECINWIPQVPQANSLSRAQLIGTPGIASFGTTGEDEARGHHVMNSIAYSVNGSSLYRINSNGTTDNLGTIAGGTRVSMADNGTQLCIVVPNSTGYIFTEPSTLTQITDPDFTASGKSLQVAYKDGYFVHISKTAIFLSDLNNGLSYDALAFGTAEVDPDENTAVHVNRNQLFVAGNETIELFQNIGVGTFPFQRVDGAVTQKGIKAKFSVVDFDNSFVFLGAGTNERVAIWRYTGPSAVKISTDAIDNAIQGYSDGQLKAVYATTYSQDGKYFANFHFPDKTFTYDATATALAGKPMWHERRSLNSALLLTKWRVGGIMEAYGKILVNDNVDGRIGELSEDVYTEYGTKITRTVSNSPLMAQGENLFINWVELTMESGVGNIVDPGSDPQISKSHSDDGFEFGNETSRSLGKIGQYKKRQVWHQEGMATRFRVYRFRMTEAVKAVIIKIEADIETGI
jgi:hypothetical protein